MPAAEPETPAVPPYARQPAPRWPEPGAGGAAEPDGGASQQIEPEPVDTGPVPLGVARTPTGNADVDAALDRLADADELPTGSHLEVYEDAHGRMREALEELDRTQGPPPPAPTGPAHAGPAHASPAHAPGPYGQGRPGPAQAPVRPAPANPGQAPYGQGHARPAPPAPSPAPPGATPPRPAHPYRPGNP
ncbi:hypothetical protein GCM10010400_61890 [Streptomyces aculeolatus]